MRVNQKMLWICRRATGRQRPRAEALPVRLRGTIDPRSPPGDGSISDPGQAPFRPSIRDLPARTGVTQRLMSQSASPASVAPGFKTNLIVALVVLSGGWLAIALIGRHDPALHTVLDTSVALTGALITLLL